MDELYAAVDSLAPTSFNVEPTTVEELLADQLNNPIQR